ncbi:unnamed protein product [Lota lota]
MKRAVECRKTCALGKHWEEETQRRCIAHLPEILIIIFLYAMEKYKMAAAASVLLPSVPVALPVLQLSSLLCAGLGLSQRPLPSPQCVLSLDPSLPSWQAWLLHASRSPATEETKVAEETENYGS